MCEIMRNAYYRRKRQYTEYIRETYGYQEHIGDCTYLFLESQIVCLGIKNGKKQLRCSRSLIANIEYLYREILGQKFNARKIPGIKFRGPKCFFEGQLGVDNIDVDLLGGDGSGKKTEELEQAFFQDLNY